VKYRVIVVDDRHVERKKGYKRLEKAVSELVPGFEIEMDFVLHPNELAVKARRTRYAGAIVDAVLDEEWPDFTISDAIKYLGDELPIAILSGQWDNTNSTEINDAWQHPSCRTFLHWRDIDPAGNGQLDFAVRALTSMIADNERIDSQFHIGYDDPLRIVHISDVQAGGFDDKALRLESSRCADRILEYWRDAPPSFIAFTGDVAECGRPGEYESARNWIAYFCERMEMGPLPTSRILYVPGNHDVNLSLAAASRLKIRPNKRTGKLSITVVGDQQEDIIRYAYAPFRQFLSEICTCPFLSLDANDQNLAWVETRYRHLGVMFYGINTAQPASAFALPDRRVDSDALTLIGDELGAIVGSYGEDSPPVVIGLAHHCPISAGEDSAVSNTENFETFFRKRAKTALFLHGHIHKHDIEYRSGDGLRMVRSCATTLTKPAKARPDDSLRGFNLLELRRENHVVKSLLGTSFGWVGSDLKEIKTEGPWERWPDGMFHEHPHVP